MVKFFIVAFIFYSWSGDTPSVKIRQDFKFDTYPKCQSFLENYRPQLQDSLQRKFTGGDRYSIRCVDGKTLNIMQEEFGYEPEKST